MESASLPLGRQPAVAYFCMEIGVDAALPTYSGGLGVLAGDTLRAAADLGVPVVAITLLSRKGYFRQHLDARGQQSEEAHIWSPTDLLEPLQAQVKIEVEGRAVQVRAWRYIIRGVSGATVPVHFLDTAVPENEPWDQSLTDHLYGGDQRYRLCQEVVLGMGGVAMLRALGFDQIHTFHMNEGHSSLLALALLQAHTERRGLATVTDEDCRVVRQRCIFTTHTPVAAGHDRFPLDMVRQVLGDQRTEALRTMGGVTDHILNMTHLALASSRYTNAVSMRHQEVSQAMFPRHGLKAITNGVHAGTWTSPSFQDLFQRHIPDWRRDNSYLRYAVRIPLEEIRAAHAAAKREMIAEVARRGRVRFDPDVLTLGFARRATAYKRADLMFADLDRLRQIARNVGPIQVVCGGKAHPRDEDGKAMIRRVFDAANALGGAVRVVYLEEYDLTLGKVLTAGVDVWVNNPTKPLEASGTSGMKAALNGVPSLSVLDGWWVEGCVEGVTGWSIGEPWPVPSESRAEAASLHAKLEQVVLPLYYRRPVEWAQVMRWAIAVNGSFFNTQRMVQQYAHNAYAVARE